MILSVQGRELVRRCEQVWPSLQQALLNPVDLSSVAGIVRPEDITAANTVRHEQIAEARISYGGRGDITRVQAPPAAQALAERFSPF